MLKKIEFVDEFLYENLEEALNMQDKFLMINEENFYFKFIRMSDKIKLKIYKVN